MCATYAMRGGRKKSARLISEDLRGQSRLHSAQRHPPRVHDVANRSLPLLSVMEKLSKGTSNTLDTSTRHKVPSPCELGLPQKGLTDCRGCPSDLELSAGRGSDIPTSEAALTCIGKVRCSPKSRGRRCIPVLVYTLGLLRANLIPQSARVEHLPLDESPPPLFPIQFSSWVAVSAKCPAYCCQRMPPAMTDVDVNEVLRRRCRQSPLCFLALL